MIEIKRYTPQEKKIWDEFVESSKNGTFLFNRGYMDYHSDRFDDFSLLIYRKEKLYCLLPANLKENVVYSHQGLTYGGLIMGYECTAEGILEVFEELVKFLRAEGITKLIYKAIPNIYHKYPAEEDLYALFRHNARLIVRNVSSTLPLRNSLSFKKDRREATSRALRNNLIVKETKDFKSFWRILENNLQNSYDVKPVHTLEEIELLASRFPENIKLFCSYRDEEMMGGILVYFTPMTAHLQYISASPEGKKIGAVDIIVKNLKDYIFVDETYLDFGTSNEDGGRYLNESLIYQKEGFGGRAVCYDVYEVEV